LLKRDTLAQLGDASGSRSAGVEAKRAIKDLKTRLEALDKGLPLVEGLGQGERSRRQGMMEGLRDEALNVEKMAEAGVRVAPPSHASGSGSPSGSRTHTPPINESARTALLGPTSTGSSRVFGSAARSTPQETVHTRPLDTDGLVLLQKTQMEDQDAQLTQLSAVLQRQMKIGQEIGREVSEQNEMLDEISGEVDRVGGKLGRAKRQMNRYVLGVHGWVDG
jgi:regulator of vacuolar morphogenesis